MKLKILEKKIVGIVLLITFMFITTIGSNVFHAESILNPNAISTIFKDSSLANKVAVKLTKKVSDTVTQDELNSINTLDGSTSFITNIDGIQYLNNLISLNLEVNSITDISFLADLTNLTSVNLASNKITDIGVIANLTKLSSLNLSKNSISSFSALRNLTGLTSLNVSNNAGIDLSDLTTNTGLQSLSADNLGITNLTLLQTFGGLNYLSLQKNAITDVTPLSTLSELRKLYLDLNSVADIAPLTTLTSLNELSINSNKVSDLSSITTMTLLNKLSVSSNPIVSVEAVRNLGMLIYLEFNVTGVSDISPVNNLVELTYLSFNLISNKVTDLTPVANLLQLKDLHFNGNSISSLVPLNNLTNLKTLWMSDNKITDLSPIANITALESIYFGSNQINDISIINTMNTSALKVINGERNHIIDISPLSSISNPYTSIVYFMDQTATIPLLQTQKKYIDVDNVTTDLDGTPLLGSFEAIDQSSISSARSIVVNGVLAKNGEDLTYSGLSVGEYTLGYKISRSQGFLSATLKYSVIVSQDVDVLEPYYVTYNGNGSTSGDVPIDDTEYVSGDNPVVLTEGTLERDAATFKQWNTKIDGSGTNYSADDVIANIESDITLYAVWQLDPIIPAEPIIPEEPIIPIKPITPTIKVTPDVVVEIVDTKQPDNVVVIVESDEVATYDSIKTTQMYILGGFSLLLVGAILIDYTFRKHRLERK